jgi:hypothetical protein
MWHSLGQPMRMTEAIYISFMHTLHATHEWKEPPRC